MKINAKIFPKIRRTVLTILVSAFLATNAEAFSAKDIRLMTFENGLKMYLIEDTSSALVRMEIRTAAGYSAQDESNVGYFPLYARLKNAMIDSESATRLQICAPSDAEKAMQSLSEMLEPLALSETKLRAEINNEQASTTLYASDAAGFINSAIEAKVYPEAPWKRESSTNPAIFREKSISESRAILNDIARNYYTSDKTVLYVSGNITAVAAETYAKRYFGKFKKAETRRTESEAERRIKGDIKSGRLDTGRLFVLTDPKFSDEMAQVVVQYTSLTQEECDMAATAMEEEFSLFKKRLTEDKTLGIRGNEYINAASAQKAGSSRLLIQTLMERTKTPQAEQIKSLMEKLDGSFFTKEAFDYEINQYTSSFVQRCDSSTEIMQTLADWASLRGDESPEKTLFNRIETLKNTDPEKLSKKIASEKPFVFVLMNSAQYAKNEKEFSKMGFRQITKKDGAWFNQPYYKEVTKTRNTMANNLEEESEESRTEFDTFFSAKRFVEKNKEDTSTTKLANGIPAAIKRTNTNMAALAITIMGGDLTFKDDIGLSTVLVDALALNIRSQLDILHFNGSTKGMYSVTAKTEPTHSVITVKFESDETRQTLAAITAALIYGDITPVMADGICYDERTQWRQKIGTGEFQLESFAMRKLYEKSDIALIYDISKDKPAELTFNKIMENYPVMIDSSRYSLALAGNFQDEKEILETLDGTFGSLGTNKATAYKATKAKEPQLNLQEKRIAMKHLFLTDVSPEKAGPMPATLIPTTKFLDPALYIMKSPSPSTTDAALFNALLSELAERIERKAEAIQTTEKPTLVKVIPATAQIPFARLVATNVERTSMLEKYTKEAIEELRADLKRIESEEENARRERLIAQAEFSVEKEAPRFEKAELISKIENKWIMENLSESGTAAGSAALMQKSAMEGNANRYLDQYAAVDSADASAYGRIMDAYITEVPKNRIYSADSKK